MDNLDSILDQARSLYEGEIDFAGQHLAELLSTVLLAVSGALAFLAGFLTQDIYNTLYIGLGGTALTFLVAVPPWPWFKQNPLPFLPGRNTMGAVGGGGIVVDGKRIG